MTTAERVMLLVRKNHLTGANSALKAFTLVLKELAREQFSKENVLLLLEEAQKSVESDLHKTNKALEEQAE